MCTRWWTLADTLAKVKAVGDKRDDVQAIFDTLADTLAKVEAVILGDPQGDAHALVELWLTR